MDLRSRSFDATEVEGTSVLQMDRKRDGINEEKKDITNALFSYAKVLKYNPEYTLSLERVAILKKKR